MYPKPEWRYMLTRVSALCCSDKNFSPVSKSMECRSWQLQPMVVLELVFSSTHHFVLLYVTHKRQPATLGVCGLSNCLNMGLRENISGPYRGREVEPLRAMLAAFCISSRDKSWCKLILSCSHSRRMPILKRLIISS